MQSPENQRLAGRALRRHLARQFRRLIPFCTLIAGGCLTGRAWTSGGVWLLQAFVLHIIADFLGRLDHL